MQLDPQDKSVQNVFIRRKAKAIYTAHRSRIILLVVCVYGIGTLLGGIAQALGDPQTQVVATETGVNVSYSNQSPLAAVASVLASLLVAPLAMGLIRCMIDYVRGADEVEISAIFCRMGCFFKAVGLQLMTWLKVWLWALPGAAVIGIFALIGVAAMDGPTMALGVVAGIALMIGLVIPAALRYILAPSCMADDGSRGIMACIALSKRMMQGRKWQYFKLQLSYMAKFVGMMLLVMFALLFLLMLLGQTDSPFGVLVMTIAPVIGLAAGVTVLSQGALAHALFYDARLNETGAQAE